MLKGASLLVFSLALLARGAEEVLSRYELVSKGLTIGSAETTRTLVELDGVELTRMDVTTKVDVNLLILKCRVDAAETALLGPDGLVAFHIRTDKDGSRTETSGAMTNGVFHFTRVDKGATNRFELARTNYVACTLDGLELSLVKGAPAVTNRVFDCARGEACDRTYRWIADEELAVGGRKMQCRVIEYADDQKSGRRWICSDRLGMVIVRQDAREPAGSYSLRLKEHLARVVPATAGP